MKKSTLIVLAVLWLAGCSSFREAMTVSTGTMITSTAAQAMDFRESEVLCSWGEGSMMDVEYWVATILTTASAATKNQNEVLYVSDGKRAWAQYTVPSHKATKAELQVGSTVFAIGFATEGKNEITRADYYRSGQWGLGRITNSDELFKNLVEIDGWKLHISRVRIPEIPIKE